jgi:SAM-dependent methyltransferase
MHENAGLLFLRHARESFRSGMRVLEIGPDAVPSSFQKLVADDSIVWETLDVLHEGRWVAAEALTYCVDHPTDLLGVPSERYDVVLSCQVIEHVKRPWRWLREQARVCKVGGTVITIGPISWPFHQPPADCWRVYPEGLRALYEDAGLDVRLVTMDALEPRRPQIGRRWWLGKQTVKAFLGREPHLDPLVPDLVPVVDSLAIGIRRPA